MFDEKLFEYDEKTHMGKYNGKPIPSVTQLVDILFPISSDIPKERIEKAGEHGTMVHKGIETINVGFDNPLDFETNIEIACRDAQKIGVPELLDYVSLISAYKLEPFDFEELIFLFDENGEPICFGHYDLTCRALKDNILFIENRLYLFDVKTTSLFNKKKVGLQESIYALAYEQCSKNQIENIYGLWLEQGAKIMPLERLENGFVVSLCKQLRKTWEKTL